MSKAKNIVIVILLLIIAYLYTDKPVISEIKETTTIEEEVVVIKDSTETKDISKPTIVYVTKIKNVSKDSIVYVTKEDTASVKVNVYDEVLKTENVTAKLKILTTGELTKVFATFETKERIKTVTTLNKSFVLKSNIFIGGMVHFVGKQNNFNETDFSFTLDYAHKDKFLAGVYISPITKSFGFRAAIKIF